MNNIGVTAATTPPEHNGAPEATMPEQSGECLQEDAFRLPVKFNKQDYQLNLEEATVYAQKGMKFEQLEPMLDSLKALAQTQGLSMREFLEVLCADNATAAVADEPSAEVSVEQRLAEEFCRLREECPDISDFAALPAAAVTMAVEENVPLLDAYLRYEHRERRRIQDAADAARAAGQASAGAQHSELQAVPDPSVAAMIAGVRGN